MEITPAGFEFYGETRIAGKIVRRTRTVGAPWSEIADILTDQANQGVVRIVPRKPGYFMAQSTLYYGLLRVRPRVDENGYLLIRWGSAELALQFLNALQQVRPPLDLADR